eukprot:GILJ01005760.1.p1 GENE.GILJ01005760.1~~GILJ01005760.1.p1  ORF type:complete len:838 (-),score=71.99 GILJ01005760.1:57-2441(-)
MESSERLFRRRVLTSLFLSNFATVFTVFFVEGSRFGTDTRVNFVVFLAASILSLFSLRWWPQYDTVVAAAMLIFFFIAGNVLLSQEGGIDVFAVSPLILLSVIALATFGTTACITVLIVCMLLVQLWFHCKTTGMEFCKASKTFSELHSIYRVGCTGVMVMNTGLALSFRGFSESLRKELGQALIDLERARDAAQTASQAKSVFLAQMSHELKTPLNGIIGMAELLLDSNLSTFQRPLVDTVFHCGKDLLTVINGILDLCRLEAKKLTLHPEPFRLSTSLRSVGRLMGELADRKKLELIFNEPLDETDLIDYQVIGDEGRLKQILINLLGNSIKFSESGTITVTVDVTCAPSECDTADSCEKPNSSKPSSIRFTVQDEGIGVPQEQQIHLFKDFSQADLSTTRQYGGTGLGLSISKMLVELMGGSIELFSEGLGKGCRVTVNVPLQVVPVVDQPSSAQINLPRPLPVTLLMSETQLRKNIEQWLASQSGVSLSLEMRDSVATSDTIFIIEDYDCLQRLLALMPVTTSSPSAPLKVLIVSQSRKTDDSETLNTLMQSHDICLLHLSKPFFSRDLIAAVFQLTRTSVGGPSESNGQLDSEGAIGSAVESMAQMCRLCPSQPTYDYTPQWSVHPSLSCVLVAEDNAVNRKLLSYQLTKLGCCHRFAEDGLQALNMYQDDVTHCTFQYGVILMDLHMPRLDGLSTVRAIRRFYEQHLTSVSANHCEIGNQSTTRIQQSREPYVRVHIIAVTADTSNETRRVVIASGFDGFIEKPIALHKLRTTLEASPLREYVLSCAE